MIFVVGEIPLPDILIFCFRRFSAMSGQQFDSGVLRVLVPTGWKLFFGIDSSGNATPKKLHIYKNAETEADILYKPGITICYFGKNEIYLSPKNFYDNVRDMEPFSLGSRMWNGYTCTSLGYPYTMLTTVSNGAVFQIMILTENQGQTNSLNDEDDRAVLESIQECR